MITIGTKVRATEKFRDRIRPGDTGTYTSGADYLPGWDAGRFDVTLDNPRTKQLVSSHWTYGEMCEFWEEM